MLAVSEIFFHNESLLSFEILIDRSIIQESHQLWKFVTGTSWQKLYFTTRTILFGSLETFCFKFIKFQPPIRKICFFERKSSQ